MTPIEIRHSVLTLHQQGSSLRDIARLLHLSRNTVRAILRPAPPPSADTGDDEPMRQRLGEAYARAMGNAVRMAQILADEHDLRPPYSRRGSNDHSPISREISCRGGASPRSTM